MIELIRKAKKFIEDSKYPHVEAVGIGYKLVNGQRTKTLAVLVFVDKKVPAGELSARSLIPPVISFGVDRVKTDVIESGKFKALSLLQEKQRPIFGGLSIGHPDITCGTLGCFVTKKGSDKTYILSNNHILSDTNRAKMGDPIIQPGTADSGKVETDTVGKLDSFVEINMTFTNCFVTKVAAAIFNALAKILHRKSRLVPVSTATNTVDCAIAKVNDDIEIKDEIYKIGRLDGIAEAELGTLVRKTGRTTGYTTGKVIAVETTVNVSYGESGTAIFTDQVISDIKSDGGDSGSAICSGNKLVGLLFAGGSGTTVLNRIQNVFEALDLEVA